MPLPEARSFAAGVPSVRGEEPLLIGLVGPPGGGKTVSALRLAAGVRRVRSGPVVLIDTEGGRSKKYSPGPGQSADPARHMFDFLRVEMTPPFRSHDFLAAIHAQLRLKPSAIIVDTLSDEHEGEGGFLEWHDEMVPKMGGNEWGAWAVPKAARKRLISGLLQIKVPMLFTFRAREKTVTEPGKGKNGKDKITNIGWMPVAPLEIVHTLDLTCILPPRADGVPVWTSEKVGEDFIVKLPSFLAPLIQGGQLSEATGEALARWAKGEPANGRPAAPAGNPGASTSAPMSGVGVEGDRGSTGQPGPILSGGSIENIGRLLKEKLPIPPNTKEDRGRELRLAFGTPVWPDICKMPEEQLAFGLEALRRNLDPLSAMGAEEKLAREPGSDDE